MIIGIGNDLVDMRRIEKVMARRGARFAQRCFTEAERDLAERRRAVGRHIDTYATRFAAKEACAKALGTGIAHGVFLRDIGVVNDEHGRPYLRLTGGARARLEALTPPGKAPALHLTFSDEPPLAQAFVMIEAV